MPKLSKESAGYVEFQGSDYHCSECWKYEPNGGKKDCAEVEGLISAIGGCNVFLEGKSGQIIPIRALTRKLSKQESGYLVNKAGFGCRRCEYFDRQGWKCEKVEGEVRPHGCCNFWSKSPVFGEI